MDWETWAVIGVLIGVLGFCAYSLIYSSGRRERAYEESKYEEENRILREGVERWRRV